MPEWLKSLGRLLTTGTANQSVRTPPYSGAPQTGQPQQQGQPQQNSAWPYIIGGGLSLAGTALQARQNNQNTQRLDDRTQLMDRLAKDEMAKREYYASILMPSLLQGMGNKDPRVLEMARQRMMALPGYGGQQQPQAPQVPQQVPQTPLTPISSGNAPSNRNEFWDEMNNAPRNLAGEFWT